MESDPAIVLPCLLNSLLFRIHCYGPGGWICKICEILKLEFGQYFTKKLARSKCWRWSFEHRKSFQRSGWGRNDLPCLLIALAFPTLCSRSNYENILLFFCFPLYCLVECKKWHLYLRIARMGWGPVLSTFKWTFLGFSGGRTLVSVAWPRLGTYIQISFTFPYLINYALKCKLRSKVTTKLVIVVV